MKGADTKGHRRRTAGVAALLPALFLAALYVAAPFAGTTTHAISAGTRLQVTATVAASASGAADSAGTAQAVSVPPTSAAASAAQPPQRSASGELPWQFADTSARTMVLWYAGFLAVALAVIAVAATRRRRPGHGLGFGLGYRRAGRADPAGQASDG